MAQDEQLERDLALQVAQRICVEGLTRKEVLKDPKLKAALKNETKVTRKLQDARAWGMVSVSDPRDREEQDWLINYELSAQLQQAIGIRSYVVDMPTVERVEDIVARLPVLDTLQVRQQLSLLDDRITGALARAAAQIVALNSTGRANLNVLSSGGRTPVFFAARLGTLPQGPVGTTDSPLVRVAPLAGDIGALPWSYASWLTLGPFNRCDANTASFLLALAYRAPEVPFLFVPGAAHEDNVKGHLEQLKRAIGHAFDPGEHTLAIIGLGRLAGAHRYMLSGRDIQDRGPMDDLQSQLKAIRECSVRCRVNDPILDGANGGLRSRLKPCYESILPFGDILNVVFPLAENLVSPGDKLWDLIKSLNRRIVSVPPTYLSRVDQVVLIAGGPLKYAALRMFVRLRHESRRLVNMLFTDRACAQALIDESKDKKLSELNAEDVVPGLKEATEVFRKLKTR